MSKTPAKKETPHNENTKGVKISGTSEYPQVTLSEHDVLKRMFGTEDDELAAALLGHCIKALKCNEASDEYPGNDERAFMLSIVNELAPRDAVERMIAVQMAATHVAAIRSARWLAHAERVEQVQTHYSGFNKLTRTFTAQMEALRKHRNWGKQTVTVQHVNVEGGGQAIVGNVRSEGR